MGSKIGITADPSAKKAYWELNQVTMSNWRILEILNSKAEAQKRQAELAEQYKCEMLGNGDNTGHPDAKWYVYYFQE